MTNKIRSASLLVRTALSDDKIVNELKADPQATLAKLEKQVLGQLPPPDAPTTKIVWIVIVGSLALVLLGSAYSLVTGVGTELKQGATYAVKSDTILTIFTTALGFLAGLLSPSPLGKKGG